MTDLIVGIDKSLEAILDQERKNLLKGGMEHFEAFTLEKTRLMDLMLKGRAPDAKSLERIRQKANRNQKLLAAAVRAVRSVNGRLSAVQNQGNSLNTYTSAGQMRQIGQTSNVRFDRRT